MPERVNPWAGDHPHEDAELVDDLLEAPPTIRHASNSVTTGSFPQSRRAAPRPRPVATPVGRWLAVLGIGAVVLGCLAGVVWSRVVPLSAYVITDTGTATITERGLAGFVAGDAAFVVLGLVLGIVCGIVSWAWFAGLGPVVVAIAAGASSAMGLLCWSVGAMLGPGPLVERLAGAAPGAVIPIELTVRSPSAVLVWPFGAVLVLMLLSALAPDPEDLGRSRPADAA